MSRAPQDPRYSQLHSHVTYPLRGRRRPLPVSLRLVLGLGMLIVVGTVFLMLPGVTTGERLSFMEALFTSTSAVTVTGLTVVTTSTDFTRWGQLILILLAQVGGVGYMFVLAFTLVLVRGRLSLMDRLTLTGSLGLDKPAGILRLSRRVLAGILIIEGLGALLLYLHWRRSGIVPADDAPFYAFFHAISAFCNAGFDLFVGLSRYPRGIPGDSLTLMLLAALVFLGGLGIPVLSDLLTWRKPQPLSLHTRLTLGATLALLLIGWIGLFIPEARPGGVLQNDPLDQQLVRSLFQSVSTRSAGFPGFEEFNRLVPESQLLVMSLMFIGSGPASMGGGITTSTLVVLTVALWSYAHSHREVQIARRTISAGTVRRAAMILIISLFSVVFASWLILMTHDLTMNRVLFEVTSAFATVGLSLGITDDLNTFGRLIIILMIFWGRLGAITLVVALVQRMAPRGQSVRYPEERVVL